MKHANRETCKNLALTTHDDVIGCRPKFLKFQTQRFSVFRFEISHFQTWALQLRAEQIWRKEIMRVLTGYILRVMNSVLPARARAQTQRFQMEICNDSMRDFKLTAFFGFKAKT